MPMLLMMLVSLLMPVLLQLMLQQEMYGMLELQPTHGLLIPGPMVLLMDMELTIKVMLLQLTAMEMHTTDGEKYKQSETNPKNLIVILCSLT